ncbi:MULTISPECIES: hypothetical protein [Rhodococcus]|uniref:Uncharacterized protein n=2 Tax=Rhodococcus TaxID=1827 RepID=Q0RWW3_RHOJR|nr:hypothetical protein [Rhodococcus jostii]ABH00223.1 hypothetical protein RHA1_ro10030 [Rhodococcus jostii RHA1]
MIARADTLRTVNDRKDVMVARKGRAQKGESDVELLAHRMVEHNSSVWLDPYDDGSENGMVDYRVFDKPEIDECRRCIGVLEVGSITNSDYRSSVGQYRQRFRGFDDSTLSCCWAVMCEFGVTFRGLQERLSPLLRKLEDKGVDALVRGRRDTSTVELERELNAIAGVVQIVRVREGERSTRVAIDFMSHATGTTTPDSTVEVVEAFLASDNKDPAGIRKKVMSEPELPYHGVYLHLDGAPEPVQDSQFGEHRHFAAPLQFDKMPSRSPKLPEGFTDLWLIGRFGQGWHWDRESGWTFVAAPPFGPQEQP